MTTKLSRRALIKHGLWGFGALSVAVGVSACGSDENKDLKVEFLHGVASGDPLQDRVIIWTRISPEETWHHFDVSWELSRDIGFNSIVRSGTVRTSAAADFTVKVDVTALQANQRYYYRFKCANQSSIIGQTKTLALNSAEVQFAVCSCSNYPAGYFHVYKEIANMDQLDAVLHLGDYIYEYEQTGYASEDAERLGRLFEPNNRNEIVSLDDYRRRYAIYRRDKDLQLAHQRHPFIVIWDDHELANDAWREGAENHQADVEGDFYARKLAALQAYFEWMPIRPISEQNHLNIYRQFNFGNLVNLMMLDTRILARDEQLDYANYMTATGLDAKKFQQDFTDPKRSLLGTQQLAWLQQGLARSQAHWQVLGQQVLMSKMLIPAELLVALSSMEMASIQTQLTELVTLKLRAQQGDPSLTNAERMRLATVAPYNLDAWDGYAAEREVILQTLKQLQKKAVVLAGDTHNAWYSKLYTQDQTQVAVELATSSVSSPGMENYLNIADAQVGQLEMAFTTLIDELQYCNLNNRGYLWLRFTEADCQANWLFVDSVKATSYQRLSTRTYQLNLDRDFNVPVAESA